VREPTWHFGRPAVPRRAVAISVAALAIPIVAGYFGPDETGGQLLVWLLALVPAFLLAYYRGWRGVTTAIAGGMAALVLGNAAALLAGRAVEPSAAMLGALVAFVGVALGIGFLSDLLHEARARAEWLALTDELTGLPNRRYARLTLAREFAAAVRGRPLTVAMFDLDRFKAFNDRHGHRAGDQALRAFGDVLVAGTRQMDLSARYGGEEFLTILSSCEPTGALAFAGRVRAALAAHPDNPHGLTVSVGLAGYDPGLQSIDQLLEAADAALYDAKRDGRDRVATHGAPAVRHASP